MQFNAPLVPFALARLESYMHHDLVNSSQAILQKEKSLNPRTCTRAHHSLRRLAAGSPGTSIAVPICLKEMQYEKITGDLKQRRSPHDDVLACLRCQHLRELWCAACPRIQAINLLHYKKKVYIRPHTTVPRGGRQGRRDPHRWFNIELNYLIKLRGSPTSSLPRYSLAREV